MQRSTQASASARVYGDGIITMNLAQSGSSRPAAIASASAAAVGLSRISSSRNSIARMLRDQKRGRARRPRNQVGGDLLSREVALRVPSARAGLTSLFGMGRGVPPPLSPPKLSGARTLKTP